MPVRTHDLTLYRWPHALALGDEFFLTFEESRQSMPPAEQFPLTQRVFREVFDNSVPWSVGLPHSSRRQLSTVLRYLPPPRKSTKPRSRNRCNCFRSCGRTNLFRGNIFAAKGLQLSANWSSVKSESFPESTASSTSRVHPEKASSTEARDLRGIGIGGRSEASNVRSFFMGGSCWRKTRTGSFNASISSTLHGSRECCDPKPLKTRLASCLTSLRSSIATPHSQLRVMPL